MKANDPLADDADVAEVVIMFYSRLMDPEQLTSLLRTLSTGAQVLIGQRLSYLSILEHCWDLPDMHYKLDLMKLDDCNAARRLFKFAVRDKGVTSFCRLLINGKSVPNLKEDEGLWGVLTSQTPEGVQPTNKLEFDFQSSNVVQQAKAVRFKTAASYIQQLWRELTSDQNPLAQAAMQFKEEVNERVIQEGVGKSIKDKVQEGAGGRLVDRSERDFVIKKITRRTNSPKMKRKTTKPTTPTKEMSKETVSSETSDSTVKPDPGS
mmetsp:Transcript_11336/g.13396  ORF Transcript_11336/g.13396 Transcript_11336/m.13396 type:complete len:264 (-) Transcript_11336:92-883(-)